MGRRPECVLAALLLSALLAAPAAAAAAAPRGLLSRSSWYPFGTISAPQEALEAWRPAEAELEGQATEQQARQRQRSTAASAQAKRPCLAFLVGIGTQKGGTTAAWAYISHRAHPRLRVSAEKEVGFWDQLHGWHKGCTLGDYVMLLNGTAEDPGGDPDVPGLCPAQLAADGAGSAGAKAAASRKRLRNSPLCGVRAELLRAAREAQERAAHASGDGGGGNGAGGGPGAVGHAASDCDERAGRPWWWFWGGWSACRPASAAAFGHDGAPPLAAGAPLPSSTGAAAGGEEQEDALLQPLVHVDITPSYLYDPMAPLWVRALLPEARVLVILREPVSRAVSNFNMRWQKRHGNDDDDDSAAGSGSGSSGGGDGSGASSDVRRMAWTAELRANVSGQVAALSRCTAVVAGSRGGGSGDGSGSGSAALLAPELAACLGLASPYDPGYQSSLFAHGMVWQGVYADGLERWLSLFPASQVQVWVSEDFKADPAAHMRQLVAWLGLDAAGLAPKLRPGAPPLRPVHVREYEADAPPDVADALRAFYAPHNERLFALLARKGYSRVAERMRAAWGQPAGSGGQATPASLQLDQDIGWSLAAPVLDVPLERRV